MSNTTKKQIIFAALSHLKPPREKTKQAKLIGMLSRKTGVTLEKASDTLGWQPHTTSATMTGLRKRGYAIVREARDGKPSIYRIDVDQCLPLAEHEPSKPENVATADEQPS
ncbi:MAG: DUF3489 domain-containing protein [Litorimonas sp.]